MKTKRKIACGKTRFRDDLEAKNALRAIKSHASEEEKIPIRCYPCKGCKGWHLTSKPKKGTS